MEKRTLGRTGLSVSVLGFGGAEFGFEGVSEGDAQAIVDEALNAGVTVFDTAAAYLQSEILLGKALGSRRKDVVLVSKCGQIDGFSRSDWSREGILETVRQSLENLGTDHLDVLLLHSCSELEFLGGEAAQGLQDAKEKGYTRFIGYSGDSSAAFAAVRSGLFDVLETSLNVCDQEAWDTTLPAAQEAKMGVIIKRPLANAVWRYTSAPENTYHMEYWRRAQKLHYDFFQDKNKAADTALRFSVFAPGVSCAITGASKRGRFTENGRIVARGPHPREEVEKIRKQWRETAERSWYGQV